MASREQEYADTGYAPIDQDHRRISEHLRALVEAVNVGKPEGAKACMATVVEQIAAHFALEERLMRETGYANYARHKEAHDTFVADARRFAKELAEKGITPTSAGGRWGACWSGSGSTSWPTTWRWASSSWR